jgi:hypothetical protein
MIVAISSAAIHGIIDPGTAPQQPEVLVPFLFSHKYERSKYLFLQLPSIAVL